MAINHKLLFWSGCRSWRNRGEQVVVVNRQFVRHKLLNRDKIYFMSF